MPQLDQKSIDTAITVAVLEEKLENLEERLAEANEKLKSLEHDRDSALKWGVIVLGSTVVSMGLWIFNLFQKHIGTLNPA